MSKVIFSNGQYWYKGFFDSNDPHGEENSEPARFVNNLDDASHFETEKDAEIPRKTQPHKHTLENSSIVDFEIAKAYESLKPLIMNSLWKRAGIIK